MSFEYGTVNWTKDDTLEAKQFWTRYRQQHDVSNRTGQTAGIDPRQGRIWFGDSIRDVVSQRDEEGVNTPLFFVRVGSETYFQKGRRTGESPLSQGE